MRVMGVDPGLARCGVVVIDGDGGRTSLATQQLIRTPSDRPVGHRLIQVSDRVTDLLTTWTPDVLAIERLLFNANAKTAMSVAHAVGVILLASARAGVEVVDYTPTQVKSTVTGHGDADKAQVRYLITAQLRLTRVPDSVDVSDAAAVALCHLWRTTGGWGSQHGGGHSARLAAALAEAGPGAQVVQRAPAGGDREQRMRS